MPDFHADTDKMLNCKITREVIKKECDVGGSGGVIGCKNQNKQTMKKINTINKIFKKIKKECHVGV